MNRALTGPFFVAIFMRRTLIILLLLTLTACTSAQKESDKIELEFWTLQLSSLSDYIEARINEYENLHPNVKIIWQDVPFKEGEKRALAASLSKKVPDVINLNPTFSSTLASKKALVNFNDYITEEQKETYLPASLEACTIGDFLFGVPWYITSSITIYNENELKEAGIDNPPATFDELIKIMPVIKEKFRHYAYIPTLAEGNYFLKILVKNGVQIVSKKGKSIYDSPKGIKTLEQWVQLFNNDLIPKESIVTTHQEAVDKFQSGASSVIIIGPNFLKTIKDNSPGLYKKVNVAPQITGETGNVNFSVMNFVVPIKSKHKKEAVEFALFITNSKNQLEFSKITPTLPSNILALNNEYFNKPQNKSLQEKARIISAKQLKKGAKGLPVLKNQQELLSILNYYIQKALLKKLSAEDALKQACQKWNEE